MESTVSAKVLDGKAAIVTGSATGIGREIAFHFAREGASVVVNYVGKSSDADDVVSSIWSSGGTAAAVEADVSQEEQVKYLVSRAIKEFGHLDVVVNNAGIEKETPFVDTPIDLWNRILAVNLTGPWLASQLAARQMIKQGTGGRIINISSVHEDLPMPTNVPYCVSKGGLRMMMRTIAVELAPYGITVNNIGPGAIDTPLDAPTKSDPQKLKTLLNEIPVGRMGRPEEVAGLAVFLASSAAGYITGSTYFIDGGMLRQSGSL